MVKYRWMITVAVTSVALVMGFVFLKARTVDKPFSLQACLESVPKNVKGLKIIEGSRSKSSIINDMVPIVCRGRALFEQMQSKDSSNTMGSITFRVVVEYTGEVVTVRVQQTDIPSRPFVNQMIRLVGNSDFVNWPREDKDTVFVYPMRFGHS